MVNSLPNEILGRLIPVTLGLLPDQPKVSVLIANHNYGEYIEEAIESVLCQTYPHFELVICDDGSTDTSREIIQRFVKFDSRVSLSCKENGGQASALNVAFDLSHGEIICLLDSDDLYDSHKLEEVVKAFRKDGDCGVCVHRLLPVSRERKSMGAAFPKTLANGWIGPAALRRGGFTDFPPSSGLCVRRGIAERVFPIPLALRKCADGYLINAAQFLSGITALHKVLAEYRYHAANIYAAAIPTVSSVNKRLDNIRLMHEVQKDFVRRHFGDDMVPYIQIDSIEPYWEQLLGLFILEGKPVGGVNGYEAKRLVENISNGGRKKLWRILLALPPEISRRAYELWWGKWAWKALLRPFSRLFRL